jgi:geranylgeranyl reductase family protein
VRLRASLRELIASLPMKRSSRVMIYGATGFTGTLIARAAVDLECVLVLGARDPERLATTARLLGLPYRAFSLDDSSATLAALGDIDFVLNAAGPFVDTSEALIASCLVTRTHYLDVAGELSVFLAAHRHDAAARERGIMIMPGVGFLIVASDCLAADIATMAPEAKYLRFGLTQSTIFSRSSLRTIFGEARDHVVVRQAEKLTQIPVGRLERQFDYGDGPRTSLAVTLADVFTAHLTTGIPNIEAYFEASVAARAGMAFTMGFGATLGTTQLHRLVDFGLSAWPARPLPVARGAAKQVIVAEAEDGWRRSRRLRMVTDDGYSFTAGAVNAILRRAIRGDLAPGFQTPGKLYGPSLALSVPGTRREELDVRGGGVAARAHDNDAIAQEPPICEIDFIAPIGAPGPLEVAKGSSRRRGRVYDAEVIVVGAGPAGASLAAKLATNGVDTLLLDRAHFPRDKVCGDFVGPAALAELATLGIPAAEIEKTNMIRRGGFVFNGEMLSEYEPRTLDGLPKLGRVIPRIHLDAMILQAARRAGARLREGVNVTNFKSNNGSAQVIFRSANGEKCLRARLVVGADGSTSVIARALRGARHPRADTFIAVRGYTEGRIGDHDRCDFCFSGDFFPGYYWVFPAGERIANIGIGMPAETLPPVEGHLRNLLLDRIRADAMPRDRLSGSRISGKIAGWPLATYNPSLRLVGDNVILLGDAAGLINPINGEGIQYALLSARWAAPIVLNCLHSDSLSRQALVGYEETVRRELGVDLAFARLIVRAISNRTLNPFWLFSLRGLSRAARMNESYAQLTAGVLAGTGKARELLSPMIVAESTVSLLEEAVHQGLGLLSEDPPALRSSGLDVTMRVPTSAVDTARWMGSLLSASLQLGTEIVKSTDVRSW